MAVTDRDPFSPSKLRLNSHPRIHLRNILESHYYHGKINMGKLNAGRFLSCDYVISSLKIWGACAFGCSALDTHSLICMSINAPRTPTEIKKTTQCLCKNRLLASKSRGTCIFPKSGSAPLIWGGLWAKSRFQPQQLLTEFNPISTSTKIPLNPP